MIERMYEGTVDFAKAWLWLLGWLAIMFNAGLAVVLAAWLILRLAG